MSTLELSDEQVISLVRGLPAEHKRAALLALAQEAHAGREDRLRWAEAQLRRASAQRGLDWNACRRMNASPSLTPYCMRNSLAAYCPA